MRRLLIAGNWKMNKTRKEADELAGEVVRCASDCVGVEVALCPPHLFRDSRPQRLTGEPADGLSHSNGPQVAGLFGDSRQRSPAHPSLDFGWDLSAREQIDNLCQMTEHLVPEAWGQGFLEVLRAQAARARSRHAGETAQRLRDGVYVHLPWKLFHD